MGKAFDGACVPLGLATHRETLNILIWSDLLALL